MSITSIGFVLFAAALITLYYWIPKRMQWWLLLAASCFFYLCCGIKNSLYVLTTASSVYAASRVMDRISDSTKQYIKANKLTLSKEEKSAYKAKQKKKRRAVMLSALLLNLGILCTFKYFHFALAQVNEIIGFFGGTPIRDTFRFIVPLGISFYTFQSVGYLVDIYWENIPAEKNYFKVLLYTSFFPQMTQGPISQYETLAGELFAEHDFSQKNYSWGLQRMIWGFCKKMLIADVFAAYVSNVFRNYADYSGLATLLGAFCYSIQIYADFSGYMDIMCGLCEVLGIRLTENFDRPYFSKSIAEYWRRWHISLGAWFKRYIYFPIGMSAWSRKLSKSTRERFGKHFSDTLPASIALVVTWLATGLWHGASWAYITWGLVNGLFIILSLWMEPVYAAMRTHLRIQDNAWHWRAFQTIRTFILVTFIKVLPEVGSLSEGWGLIRHIFTLWRIPRSFSELLPFVEREMTIQTEWFLIATLGVCIMFVFSLLQRRRPVRECFNKLPWFVRILVISVALIAIAAFGVQAGWSAGGFMYANF